ncbi:MAG: biopolymer transporter ExbD [Pirellula sp.]|jgi:biopolymer transport protein ExbD|nr:biopolymer transporter ExbD [Pirellula sp.]
MKPMIRCPKCGSIRAASPRVIGREIRCPDCDHLFLVEPSMQVDPSSIEAAEVPAQKVRSEKSRVSEGLVASSLNDDVVSEPVQVEIAPRRNPPNEDTEPEEVSFAAKELPKDDMDMTPMVDVTFLLLIFFMITASFSSEKVFEKPPPMSETPSTKPPDNPPEVYDSVRVQIDEFNAYTIIFPTGDEREASSKQDLLMALGDAKSEVSTGKEDEILKLIVEAHEECIHAAIVAALDAGREKGFSSFTVSVVEEFE